MPIARFQMPDGRIGRFEVPDGTTPEQAQSMIGEFVAKQPDLSPKLPDHPPVGDAFANGPLKIGADGFPDALRSTLKDAGWANRNIASAGTALSNLWQGGKQLVGQGDQQAIEANRIIEQEGPVGAIAGNIAATAVPFGLAGNSLKAAGAVGAGFGLMNPAQGEQSAENIIKGKALNTALGGVMGAGGQKVSNMAGNWIGNKAAALAARKSQRAPIDATIKEALDAGYVIPPGQINPSFVNRQLESMGGKIATQQMASSRNQQVTDRLARSAAGLLPDDPIMESTLSAVRKKLGTAYDDVGKVVGQDTVEQLKTLRADANDMWNMQSRNPHPETLAQAKQLSEQAKSLETSIDQVLTSLGKKDVMTAFRDARKKIAINHTVENALIEGGGTVDARTIARAAQRGDPLSGELATIGNFANNFKKVVQTDSAMGTPDAHNLKYLLSTIMAGGGGAALGPAGVAAGAIPMLSGPAARSVMFSKPVQRGLLSDYSVPTVSRMTGGLLKYAPSAATTLGLESLR